MDRNIFYWNVRGACGPNFYQNIKLACSRNNPCLVVLSETKCERVEKLQCVSKLGFDGTACVPSVGRSGGLFAAWKSDQIRVEIIHQGRQLFHFRCRFPGGCFFFVTAVYAIPDSHHKQLLWSELRSFASSMVEPWAVIGDFNDIAFSTERTGGLSSHPNRIVRVIGPSGNSSPSLPSSGSVYLCDEMRNSNGFCDQSPSKPSSAQSFPWKIEGEIMLLDSDSDQETMLTMQYALL
ncbi:hypothetical protein K1719_020183 [Acacia pycnantha]|nr:hypothetical protein K1719_020183 [Acacia pycnantha]